MEAIIEAIGVIIVFLGLLLAIIVLGFLSGAIPILIFGFEKLLKFLGILKQKWFSRLSKPKPKMPRQLTLIEFIYDRYPYERKWVIPEDLYKEAYPELTQEERDLLETQEIEEDMED